MPHPATAGVLAHLQRGSMSVCMQLIGDSTGTDTDEWFGILGYKIQQAYPEYALHWLRWDSATARYLPPRVLVPGAGGGSARGVKLTSGCLARTCTTNSTGSQYVVVGVQPTTGWQTQNGTLASRWGGGGKQWRLGVQSGYLYLDVTHPVTGTLRTTSRMPIPATGTEYLWVHAGYAPTPGQTTSTPTSQRVTFATSTNGTVWEETGSPTDFTAPAALINSTSDINLGGSDNNGTNSFDGTYRWVDYRTGTAVDGDVQTGTIVPGMPEWWDQVTTGSSLQTVGAPVILLVCGSVGGTSVVATPTSSVVPTWTPKGTSYHNDPLLRPRILGQVGVQVFFINDGHNEGNISGEKWITGYASYVDKAKAAHKAPVIVCGQNQTNPAFVPTPNKWSQRYNRGAALGNWAATQPGVYYLDFWPAFTGRDISQMVTSVTGDGIHPTQGSPDGVSDPVAEGTSGSHVLAQHAYDQLFQLPS